jgi:hypothetical protein
MLEPHQLARGRTGASPAARLSEQPWRFAGKVDFAALIRGPRTE